METWGFAVRPCQEGLEEGATRKNSACGTRTVLTRTFWLGGLFAAQASEHRQECLCYFGAEPRGVRSDL